MRYVIMIVVAAAALPFGAYQYLKHMAVDSDGATISQTFELVRARHKMSDIASEEREVFMTRKECLSPEELIEEGRLEKSDMSRAGYTFSIECQDEMHFQVVGTHTPATSDGFHWPVMAIDQDMKNVKPGE